MYIYSTNLFMSYLNIPLRLQFELIIENIESYFWNITSFDNIFGTHNVCYTAQLAICTGTTGGSIPSM